MTMSAPRPGRLLLSGLLVAAAALLAFMPAAHAQLEERISSYDVGITILQDGSLMVVERIDYDFGNSEHHGIFRDIPVRFPYDDQHDRVYPIDHVSVAGSPGTPDGFKIEHEDRLLRIRIGDENKTITGEHVYTITYRVRGALNGFRDRDELFWNAIGDQWSVPIDVAAVRIIAPGDIAQVACYSGPYGSHLPCSDALFDGATATFRQTSGPAGAALGPYEALTVVVALPIGEVAQPEPILAERWAIQRAFSLTPVTVSASAAILLLLLGALGRLIWTTGRDRRAVGSAVDVAYGTSAGGEQTVPLFEHSVMAVEYTPPEDIRPGQVGTLQDEVANPLDVTATIVDLAVRGYLRIQEIPKKRRFGKPDWRRVKLKAGAGLLTYEQILFDGLFSESGEAAVDQAEETEDAVPEEGLAQVNLSSLRTHFANRMARVQQALYADALRRGWFVARPDRARAAWGKRGWVLFLAGVGLMVLAAAKTHLGLIPVPLAIGGLVLIWSAHLMPRRTPRGVGMVRRVLGFRRYIETAEVEESRFAERENLFSQYLPYAVVFGLTEKWARAFARLGDQPPDTSSWYVGTQAFTIGSFASSIDHFTVSSAGTISSTPASSGSSGFGGGGFSGGGGGGGGGGSW
jgi:uncharacterized membrane protein YgcG